MNEVSPVSVQGGKSPVSKPGLATRSGLQEGGEVGVGVAVAVAVGVGEAVAVAVGEGDAVGVGLGVPPCTKLTKTSCCDWPLIMLRPSVQPPMVVFPAELW